MATDTKDPFNWKMPNRSDLMSLDTISINIFIIHRTHGCRIQ